MERPARCIDADKLHFIQFCLSQIGVNRKYGSAPSIQSPLVAEAGGVGPDPHPDAVERTSTLNPANYSQRFKHMHNDNDPDHNKTHAHDRPQSDKPPDSIKA